MECVHEREAESVAPELVYSGIGHVILAMGLTADPIVVKFRCKLCGKVFDESKELRVRQKYATRY